MYKTGRMKRKNSFHIQLSFASVMKIKLPGGTMTDQDLLRYTAGLNVPNFRGVKMRDELKGQKPRKSECGILNFNTHTQQGTHWTCWAKFGKERYYFDSFGETPPIELLKYLKTPSEIEQDMAVIRRSAVTVQHDDSNECGALCLYVLKQLSKGLSFPIILDGLLKRYESLTTARLVIEV